MATDDGLLIKPEPRKPWVVVAVAAGVLAVLAGGYVASGLSGKPKPAATATAASPAPVTANPDQLPAIIIAVLPLAADAGATAAPADGDASQHLVDALKGGSERGSAFNDGVSAQLAGALSQFDGVAVTSPESSFQQRDADAPPATIGKMLGATHLLRGTASRDGETLRIDAALVSVADGSTVWFDRYQRPYAELFKVQDEMAAAIGAALKVKRLPAPQGGQDERPPGGSLQAYEALLAGDAALERADADGVAAA
ncbi:MAG TPA: hypothetical protein PK399_05495, partial [Thermomonas sp.]|nr:hypothetical protein [Thermomonas sp.]